MAAESNDLEAMLKPFYQRASEAEVQKLQAFVHDEVSNVIMNYSHQERLARLEASLSGNEDSGNMELLKLVEELQSKLEDAKLEHVKEKQKSMKEVTELRAENEKLQYRIIHLVQALKDADSKLALK